MPNSALDANIQQGFTLGYRNREDLTTLKPNVLVVGSQNVLTNTFQRIGNRRGYTLDGQRSTAVNTTGIYGVYDWDKHNGTEQHLRVGFNTTGSNGMLQFRYVAAAGDKWNAHTFTEGEVYWIDLLGSRPSQEHIFCSFWDFSNELKDLCLFVDGTSNIYMWSGGVTTMASATVNTITKTGTDSWEQAGFLGTATYTRSVLINGTTYSYTGGSATTTLTGVTPDPSAEPANSVVVQAVQTITNASMTGIPSTFKNSIINNLNNQIYVSASNNNSVYVSKVNNFRDYSYTAVRLVGEGALLTLDGVPTSMNQQGQSMFISAGKKYWYATQFTASSDLAKEALTIIPRKTTSLQSAQSQYLTTKIKNLITFVSFEQQINAFGASANFFTDPQVSDISYQIVNDIVNSDFTSGQVLYFNKYIFVTAPSDGVMYIYNMTMDMTDALTDTAKHYWEAPQRLPFAKMSIIDGHLYGHGFETSNTFKLFDGYNDDSHSYQSTALFAYDTKGDSTATKSSNQFFVEGYKRQSTKLTGLLRRNVNGPVAKWSWEQLPERCLTVPVDDASIGKAPIGESPIGGTLNVTDPDGTPPKFRLIQTFPKNPYFEEQVGFMSNGVDQRWELLRFATNATLTTENQASIMDPDLA